MKVGISIPLHTHPLDTEDTISLSAGQLMDRNLCKEMLSEWDIDLERGRYSSHETARSWRMLLMASNPKTCSLLLEPMVHVLCMSILGNRDSSSSKQMLRSGVSPL